MGLLHLFHGRYLSAVFTALVGGALFGAVMTGMSWMGQRTLRRQGMPTDDFAPIQEREADLLMDVPGAFSAARHALRAIRTSRILREYPEIGEIHARTGFTMRSLGENLVVSVMALPTGGAQVRIRSEPRLKSTAVDYGRGVENVESFLRELARHGT